MTYPEAERGARAVAAEARTQGVHGEALCDLYCRTFADLMFQHPLPLVLPLGLPAPGPREEEL